VILIIWKTDIAKSFVYYIVKGMVYGFMYNNPGYLECLWWAVNLFSFLLMKVKTCGWGIRYLRTLYLFALKLYLPKVKATTWC